MNLPGRRKGKGKRTKGQLTIDGTPTMCHVPRYFILHPGNVSVMTGYYEAHFKTGDLRLRMQNRFSRGLILGAGVRICVPKQTSFHEMQFIEVLGGCLEEEGGHS